MTDKRSTQITLPLVLEEKDYQGIVKQNWQITFARQSNVGVLGKRLIGLVLAQIRKNDYKAQAYYQFRVSDLVKASDIKDKDSLYKDVKKTLDELAKVVWSFEDPEREIYYPNQLIDTNTSLKKNGYKYGYEKGMITMVFNDEVHEILLNMAHYSSFELEPYMKFRSWYSTRLWEFFSAFKDSGKWYVDIKEYRKLMDCEKKYKDTNLLIRKTTAEPQEEFIGTQFEGFICEKVYAQYSSRGRPPVIGLNFYFGRMATAKETLDKWSLVSIKHAGTIKRLRDDWKVHDEVIVRYAPAIGLTELIKLMNEWQLRQTATASNQEKINNREKYCNAVIKRIGEAKLQEQKEGK